MILEVFSDLNNPTILRCVWYLHNYERSSARPEQTCWYTSLGGGGQPSLDARKIPCTAEGRVPEEGRCCCCFPSTSLTSPFVPRLSVNPTDRGDRWVVRLSPMSRPEQPLLGMLCIAPAFSVHLVVSQQISFQGAVTGTALITTPLCYHRRSCCCLRNCCSFKIAPERTSIICPT